MRGASRAGPIQAFERPCGRASVGSRVRLPCPEERLRLPGADEARVPESKLTDYLLATDHPVGRWKAAYFRSRGFPPDAPDLLRLAILEVGRTGSVSRTVETPWGTKHYVEGSTRAPDGNRMRLATVWMVVDDGVPVLVTAYPRRDRSKR